MPETVEQEVAGTAIVEDPDRLGGAPHIAGTRIRVSDIAVRYRKGESAEEIAGTFPGVDLPAVHAALSYYHRNREDIEREVRTREDRFEEATARR
ncbi:MAG: DUF433 domain-containing protein [Candidatus Nanohaloarchaea archaeon]